MLKQPKAGRHVYWRPAQIIAVSFATIIVLGTLLLMMPFSTGAGNRTGVMDALFTATSATCVTGLVTVDTGTHWSIAGQLIILAMIQIGGLGLVTFVTFFNMLMGKKLGLRSQALARESVSGDGLQNIRLLVRMVVLISVGFELLGTLLLSCAFVPQFGPRGFYYALFLSVSAFCNAGLDPLGFIEPFGSVTAFADSPLVLGTLMMLIVAGGLGFLVWSDLLLYRRDRSISLHSRVVLIFSAALIVAGTVLTLLFEGHNPLTLGSMPAGQKLLNALFASVSSRTAGFNSFDLAAMAPGSKVMMCFFMFIGACPGSTAGGIKVTTLAVIIMTVLCVLRGDNETTIFGRRVSRDAVYKAMTLLLVGLLAVGICCAVMVQTLGAEHLAPELLPGGADILFESTSAFATVGLSVGVTGVANLPVQVMLIFTMYLGRIGPVSFALALAMRPRKSARIVLPEGKILIG